MKGACNTQKMAGLGTLGRCQKVKYHLSSITKSVSKMYQTVCVFLQIRDIKQIDPDVWPCSRGGSLGRRECTGAQLCF